MSEQITSFKLHFVTVCLVKWILPYTQVEPRQSVAGKPARANCGSNPKLITTTRDTRTGVPCCGGSRWILAATPRERRRQSEQITKNILLSSAASREPPNKVGLLITASACGEMDFAVSASGTSAKRRGQARSRELWFELRTHNHNKGHPNGCPLLWWEEVDSNHRSRRRQIYSLMHLATLQSARIKFSPRRPRGLCVGAGDWNRTHNLLITNQLLCQLSYTSANPRRVVPWGGIEPPTYGFSVHRSTD